MGFRGMTQEDLDMAHINRIMSYGDMSKDEAPHCWKLSTHDRFQSGIFGKDSVAVYRTDVEGCPDRVETCVLAVAGSDDLVDGINNWNILPFGEFCGYNHFHGGIAAEARSMFAQSDKWNPFKDELAQCSRIVVSGHSLGGAVATVLATCMNCKSCEKPAGLDAIKKEVELYTFAAYAVHTDPPENSMHPEGVFKGKRIWGYRSTSNLWTVDLIPTIMKISGFRHPKILTIGLDVSSDHAKIEEGSDEDAPDEPRGTFIPDANLNRLHHMDSYVGAVLGHMKGSTPKPKEEEANSNSF